MKLYFIICTFWIATLIKAVPNDYKQRLQSRDIGDLPIVNWFFDNDTKNSKEDSKDLNAPAPSEGTSKSELMLKETDDIANDNKIKIIPVDKIDPSDEPEPIENLFKNLKQEVGESVDEEKKAILEDFDKSIKKTPTNIAKIFINKAWHIFNIGSLGTTRRTRVVGEVDFILIPLLGAILGRVGEIASTGLQFFTISYWNNDESSGIEIKSGKHPEAEQKPASEASQQTDGTELPDISKMDLSSWKAEYDTMLEDMEKKMKDPTLEPKSRRKIIDFVFRWYTTDSTDPKVKCKFDGLLNMIKEDPMNDETFVKIKEDNNAKDTKKIFNLFEKNPDDYVYAKIPLTEKIDNLSQFYDLKQPCKRIRRAKPDFISDEDDAQRIKKIEDSINNNPEEYRNFETVLDIIPNEIPKPNGMITKLNSFKFYLRRTDPEATGKIYLLQAEKDKMLESKGKKVGIRSSSKDEKKPKVDDVKDVDTIELPDVSKMDLPSWKNMSHDILELIKGRIKTKNLGPNSKRRVVNFIAELDKDGLIKSHGKSEVDELITMINQDPQFDETFKEIKDGNAADKERILHNLFGKDRNNQIHAKMPLFKKIELMRLFFELSKPGRHLQAGFVSEEDEKQKMAEINSSINNNKEDFHNFKTILVPQEMKPDVAVGVLDRFANYLLRNDCLANGKIYLLEEEKKKMQEFMDCERKRNGSEGKYPVLEIEAVRKERSLTNKLAILGKLAWLASYEQLYNSESKLGGYEKEEAEWTALVNKEKENFGCLEKMLIPKGIKTEPLQAMITLIAFRKHLFKTDPSASEKIYSKNEEKKMVDEFLALSKNSSVP